jgi:hypothetical protein
MIGSIHCIILAGLLTSSGAMPGRVSTTAGGGTAVAV